jgi:diguanylate cyclase
MQSRGQPSNPAMQVPEDRKLWAFELSAALVFALYFSDVPQPWWMWVWMLVYFVLAPHLAQRLVERSADPLRSAGFWLCGQAFVLGLWTATLGFPLWPSYVVLLVNALRLTTALSWRGLGWHLLYAVLGMAVVSAFRAQLHWAPEVSLTVALCCMVHLTVYLCMSALGAHERTHALVQARGVLGTAQQALQACLGEVETLQQRLSDQAHRDPLTGLYHRRHLLDRFEAVVQDGRARGAAVSVLLLDIDHFQRVNTELGQLRGDAVLGRVAGWLSQAMRSTDLCGRYGGDVFLLVLPDADLAAATECAERSRLAVASHDWAAEGLPAGVTVSIGVAEAGPASEAPAAMIVRVEQALIRAKSRGGNQVQAAA